MNKTTLTICDKLRYKVWKHLRKELLRKAEKVNYLTRSSFCDKMKYKLLKHLYKRLLKKGLVSDFSADQAICKEYADNTLGVRFLQEYMEKLSDIKRSAPMEQSSPMERSAPILSREDQLWNALPQKYKDIYILQNKKPTENEVRQICLEDHYENVIARIKKRVHQGEKIQIVFLCLGNINCPWSLANALNKDPLFDVKILLSGVWTNPRETIYAESLSFKKRFSNLYPDLEFILPLENAQADPYDLSKCDILYIANPYAVFWPSEWQIPNLVAKNCLLIYANYGYLCTSYAYHVLKIEELSLVWKIFVENEEIQSIVESNSVLTEARSVVTGYVRTDNFSAIEKVKRERKKIVIATHSTSKVRPHGIEFASFPLFANALLHLPEKYPNVDFVFRPHPLQWKYLVEDGSWTQEQVNDYIAKMQSYPNLVYQYPSDDFADSFVNSDGIIHDCASFTAEYLFTGNPACYLCDADKKYKMLFTPMGYECWEYHSHAYNERDLHDFVDTIIHGENASDREKRQDFVNRRLKINYGHVGETILSYLKKTLF